MDIQIKWQDRLGSTNRFIKNEITQCRTPAHGTLIAAYDQTDGMGRENRSWISTPATNLCFSLFADTRPTPKIPSLTMAVSLAIHDTLREKRIHAIPKWPNDLLVEGKKICGILSECTELPHSNDRGVILGIGLNVNMNALQQADIDQPATSIFLETGNTCPLEPLLERVVEHLSLIGSNNGINTALSIIDLSGKRSATTWAKAGGQRWSRLCGRCFAGVWRTWRIKVKNLIGRTHFLGGRNTMVKLRVIVILALMISGCAYTTPLCHTPPSTT